MNSHHPLDRKSLPELGSFPISETTKWEGKYDFDTIILWWTLSLFHTKSNKSNNKKNISAERRPLHT